MRRYSKGVKLIKKEFDKQLKTLYEIDPESVLAYIWYKRIHKTNISKERKQQIVLEARKEFSIGAMSHNEFIAYLIERQQKVKDVVQNFKSAIVETLAERGVTLNYVTTRTPKEIGYLIKPRLEETIYNESIGNYVFASLEKVSKLRQAVSISTGGMINIGEQMIMFPSSNNLEIKDGKISLINPVYNYSVDVKYFEPVVSVRIDYPKTGKTPTIVFDDQWASCDEIYVADINCEKIEDVTEILDQCKLFMFTNNNTEKNFKIANNLVDRTKREVKKSLMSMLQKGEIKYLNAELKQSLETK